MTTPIPQLRALINIDVPDLEAGIAFYTAALPLHAGRRLGAWAVELLGAEVPIYLLEKAAGSLAFEQEPTSESAAVRSYARHWTPVHLDLVVHELAPAVARARAAGAAVEGISSHSWGELALLVDPFGHGFCLIELRGRGYDEITTEASGT
ncbi:MAG TPA: VOC family protein [Polyangiaceae bacterium]